MRVKLSKWANLNGVHYQTALRYHHQGIIPSYQLANGTILVELENEFDPSDVKEITEHKIAVIYTRVSSAENKSNLEEQAVRCEKWAQAAGYVVKASIKEIGSGLNDNRNKLNHLLKTGDFDVLVVEHKDRLTRFGEPYIRLLLEERAQELIIINETRTDEEDLIQDFVSIITSYCARIYGRRRTKRATERLISELKSGENSGG